MIWQVLTAGFTIGIVGSFHCIGMCGPLALALPVADESQWKKTFYITLYNLGRIVAYASIGALLGTLGSEFFIGKYQQYLSIGLGILLILVLLGVKIFNGYNSFLYQITQPIKNALGRLMNGEKKFYTYLLIGFLNGFLPCGLVYVAVAGAVATGDVTQSALFMGAFGLGTFPAMFSITVLGKMISIQWRSNLKKASPFVIGLMAVLLILRGLNLGIPYISPEMKATSHGTESCCHKDKEACHN